MKAWAANETLKSVLFEKDVLNKDLKIIESKNALIKPNDVLNVTIGKGCYNELNGDIIFVTVYNTEADGRPKDVRCWKFVPTEQMISDENFDTMDWRDELDDMRNLSIWNFFHPSSLEKFFELIKF